MHNGIHSMDEIIKYIVENAIYDMGWKYNWQKYFMAEAFNITIGELEAVCEYLNLEAAKHFEV